ncbi:MAG: DUF2974 domain-containing protein [Lachnospiraceae bacterium]|nr:DUF2974 domain-containing protein [Lachnospiraceae bacterium]
MKNTVADKMLNTVTEIVSEKVTETVNEVNQHFAQIRKQKSTIVEYARFCTATFDEEPFNEVDSLILSWVAYLKLPEEMLPGGPLERAVGDGDELFRDTSSCRFSDLLQAGYYSGMLSQIWSADETLELLQALAQSPRFCRVRLCLHREELDREEVKQFAALTCQLKPDLTYVAFRGTDKTITGWEEDFRLCLIDPVPSQTLAARYLSAVGRIFRGKLLVGGHSKGGNLAVYAAAFCDPEVQERIETVYSHDGPGFLPEDLTREGFRRIQPRIQKTAPQFSVFGMLMEQETEPKIIYSYETGIMQHNAMSWKTEGYGLVECENSSIISQKLKNKLNNWLNGLTQEERRLFIDTVIHILDETGIEKFGAFPASLAELLPVVIREFSKLSPEMQDFLFGLLKEFLLASDEESEGEKEQNIAEDNRSRIEENSGRDTSDDSWNGSADDNRNIPGHLEYIMGHLERKLRKAVSVGNVKETQSDADLLAAYEQLNRKKKMSDDIEELMRKYQ